jgi:signal transduction histidine kinase
VDTREPGTLGEISWFETGGGARRRLVDFGLAVLVTALSLGYALLAMSPSPAWPALVVCVVLTGAIVGWRWHPPAAAGVVVSALIVYSLVTVRVPPAPVVAAPVLIFYSLGRATRRASDTRSRLVLLALLVYGFGATMITGHTAGVSAVGAWLAFLLLPAAAGVVIESRWELQHRLEAVAAMLNRSAAVLARRAAGAERDRMARELHDVVAHTVSLMVIQTNGAREILGRDLASAREAMAVVSCSGREALVELRRIVGSLPAEESELGGPSLPCLAHLDELIERARAAGLEVEAILDRPVGPLAPGIELTGYRLLQEALTNVLKHAGPTRVFVRVRIDRDALEIEVADAGGGRGMQAVPGEPGHGLAGMRERVAIYGGRLDVGPLASGGYRVRTRLPLEAAAPPLEARQAPGSGSIATSAHPSHAGFAARWGWIADPILSGLLLAGFAAVALTEERRGPLILELVAVALIPAAAIWRRQVPLLLMGVVAALSLPMVWTPTPTGLYALLVPPYTVGAWGGGRQAAVGIAMWAAAETFSGRVTRGDGSIGDILSPIAISAIALATGLAMRRYRARAGELERANAQLTSEREERALMAIADERARIARELHVAIARDVATMVVQAEAASVLLERNVEEADAALAAIVATGRPALAEMRRIVGVLRHPDLVGIEEPTLAVAGVGSAPEGLRVGGALA